MLKLTLKPMFDVDVVWADVDVVDHIDVGADADVDVDVDVV